MGSFAEGMGGGFLEGLLEGRHEQYEHDRTQAEESYKQGSQRLQDIVTSMETDPNSPYSTKYLLDVMAEQQKLQAGPTKGKRSLSWDKMDPQLSFLKNVMDRKSGMGPTDTDANLAQITQASRLFGPNIKGGAHRQELSEAASSQEEKPPVQDPPPGPRSNSALAEAAQEAVASTPAPSAPAAPPGVMTGMLEGQQPTKPGADWTGLAQQIRESVPDPYEPSDNFILSPEEREGRKLNYQARAQALRLADQAEQLEMAYGAGLSDDQVASLFGMTHQPERQRALGDPEDYMIYSAEGQPDVIAASTQDGRLVHAATGAPFDPTDYTLTDTIGGRSAEKRAEITAAGFRGGRFSRVPTADGRGYVLFDNQNPDDPGRVIQNPEGATTNRTDVGSIAFDPIGDAIGTIHSGWVTAIDEAVAASLGGIGSSAATLADRARIEDAALNDPATGVRAGLSRSTDPQAGAMLDRINAAAGGPGVPLTLQSLLVARSERGPTSGVPVGQDAGAPPPDLAMLDQVNTFQGWKVDDAAPESDDFYVNPLEFTELYDSPGPMGQAMQQVVEGWITGGVPGLSGLTTPELLSRLTANRMLWKRFHDEVGNAIGLNSVR